MHHYWVDGYNLLFRHLAPVKNFEQSRNFLLSFIETHLKIPATIIFDGHHRAELEPSFYHFGHLKVIFTSKGQTADEYILEELPFQSKKTIVVTSDKNLSLNCKNLGFTVDSLDAFLKKLEKKKTFLPSTKFENSLMDSPKNIERLLKIFESRYKENFPENSSDF